jgi:hypothetical protein
MSVDDYSGIDVAAGHVWSRAGWSLFSVGLVVASIGFAIVLLHVLVVLMYSRSLAEFR